jgi:hypothetical protein
MNLNLKPPRQISVGWTIAFAVMLSALLFIVTQLFVVPPCGRIISAAECPVGDTVTFNDSIGIKGGSNFTITLAASSTPTLDSTVRIPADEDGVLLTSGSDIPISSLGNGTSRQLLQTNAGATSAEWTSGIQPYTSYQQQTDQQTRFLAPMAAEILIGLLRAVALRPDHLDRYSLMIRVVLEVMQICSGMILQKN